MQNLEIERKFLVAEKPADLDSYPSQKILQGYIVITDDIEIRLRRKGEKFYQTVKCGEGLVRTEVEIEMAPEQFEQFWPLTEGRRVEKRRYELGYGDATIELDVYSGIFAGLLTAEVEFDSEAASHAFTPPSWLGLEITHDKRYKNKNLVVNGLPD